ncbi:MAG TPA: DUF58 domain-containing protein [Candidatus Acidoferrales bacterium]|nr:DUF58 domain-containing protein [Candidatus Acidoferrales bacterium]
MSDPISEAGEARYRAARMHEAVRHPPILGRVPPIIGPRTGTGPPPLLPARSLGRRLLSPAELERFGNLLLFARATVEGYFAGKHRSPFRGSSVEFTDYKEYVPGDDPKRIDWRSYGRSRRLFVRQFEAETDMVIYLLVDVSASMNYAGMDRETKYMLAAKIAAALAYLMIHQGDKAALGLFAETLKRFLPAGGTRSHLHHLIAELEVVQPMSTTGIAHALTECNSLFKRRGLLVVLSDFWDDSEQTFDALSRFLHRKFEILLLQIVHPHELDLPDVPAARFQDMETQAQVRVEPEEIRASYRELARQRVNAFAREANLRRISHALVHTDRPYLEAFEAYLGFRGRNTFSTR